jgi:Bacterial Ig-like domain
MRRLRITVLAFVVFMVLVGAAIAYLHGLGSGTAAANVGTLGAPSNVSATAPAGDGTVAVGWNASPLVNGISPQGYYVLRHQSGGGTVAACGTSPSSLTTATSCNDVTVPNGSYTYTVIAKYHSFTASAVSNQVTVINDTTAPSVTVNQKAGQADPASVLPIVFTVTFSESVTGFIAGDVTRGGTSTGGTVAVTGSGASYEISLSGAVTDGTVSFSITAAKAQDLAGNNNTASTSTDNTVTYDGTAPALTLTAPANGSATTDTTPTISGAAGNGATDSTTVTVKIYNGTGTGGTVAQTLTPTRTTTTWTTTAATLAQGTYTAQATQTDSAGNIATSTANTFAVDTTVPTVTALNMFDTDADGRVDQVKATFDETLASSTAIAPWALTNVPSAGSLSAVATSGAVATLTLNEGAGAADTSVGLFAIALATSASGIRDAAGNQASFAAAAPDDGAGPVLMTATSTAGATANRMQAGDTFVLTFSEGLAPSSLTSNYVVSEQRAGGATLSIPGLINSATIGSNYLGANNSSGTSNTSPSLLSNVNKTVTVTLGSITVTGSGVATGTAGATITPSSSLTDPAGNAARTTGRAMSPLF